MAPIRSVVKSLPFGNALPREPCFDISSVVKLMAVGARKIFLHFFYGAVKNSNRWRHVQKGRCDVELSRTLQKSSEFWVIRYNSPLSLSLYEKMESNANEQWLAIRSTDGSPNLFLRDEIVPRARRQGATLKGNSSGTVDILIWDWKASTPMCLY